MVVIDLGFPVYYSHSIFRKKGGMVNEYRKNNICLTDRLLAHARVPQIQRGNQNSHTVGSAWQYSFVYQDYRGKSSRCIHSRRIDSRARIFLCHESWLPRLYTLTQSLTHFVTRAKTNLKFRRLYSHSVQFYRF